MAKSARNIKPIDDLPISARAKEEFRRLGADVIFDGNLETDSSKNPAHRNWVQLDFDSQILSEHDIKLFIEAVIEDWSRTVNNECPSGHYFFYFWYQFPLGFNFSLVPVDCWPPFGSALDIVGSLDAIIDEGYGQPNYIIFDELVDVPPDANVEEKTEESVLRVYRRGLPEGDR